MSRVSLIEQLYAPKRKSALEFDYDALWAPPIRYLLNQQDINELYRIATSLKYNDNIFLQEDLSSYLLLLLLLIQGFPFENKDIV